MKYLRIHIKRKLQLLAVVILMMITSSLSAQEFSFQFWHKGFIISSERDTISGEIKYDMESNAIQVKTDEKVYSYSSHNIILCDFFDVTIENSRRFYSIPYEIRTGYKSKILFELLYEGPLSLLSREEMVQEPVPAVGGFGGTVIRNRMKNNYYFLNNKGKVTYFSGKKAELFEILSNKSSSVKSFVKENKLKTDELRDLIRIIAFYNSI